MLRRRGLTSRSLAALVFTDIVGSTELAARVGDDAWKRLLERHQRLIRSALARWGGREIDTAGDGFYATFGAPARAITFALAAAEQSKALGIRVRSGVHVGEVEQIGGKAGGIAVHIGARIAARAEPGEVLVSATVRDLVAGSDVAFAERGIAELKGVPGTWALYSATALERQADLTVEARRPTTERISAALSTTRGRLAVVVAVAAVVTASAVATNGLLQPRFLPGVDANSVGRIGHGGNAIVSAMQVGSLPDAIAIGEGALWVTDTTAGSVARIDPGDSRVVQTIGVGSSPNAVTVGHGAVWVTNGSDGLVSRVSPATNEEIATIPVGNGPSGVATDDRWVWVTNRLDGTLSRIDPQGHEVTSFPIGTTPVGVATGAGSVWVSDFFTGAVLRVDPGSGKSVARIAVGNGPTSIAATADQVWVVNSRDGTVTRIDPATNVVAATIRVGDQPETVAPGDSVWVTVASSADIVRIDPGTNTIERRIPVQSRPRGIALAGDEPWFTARAASTSHRGGTLRIVTDPTRMPTTLDPADPGADTIGAWDTLLLTNDGLIGFKRVGGSEGSTLVPNLAVSIPTPTDEGRTYTFTIRKGITYDDGRPVQAMDVRRSVERFFRLNPSDIDLDVYGSLEGADACAAEPDTCDLSSAIEVDETAGSVTFRLARADAEFLQNLAHPPAFVLPADTPQTLATDPLPATGPYIAQPFDAEGGIRLVRNPRFKEWSHEAQPDGYPDEIVWRAVPEAEAVTLVEAGDADVLPWIPNDRIDDLRTRYSDQLHALPPSITFFEFMNTTLPPFDQVDVRRAVNLATDRARLVELNGGPISARITCQATPPGFPGYQAYCPYTVSPGGAWRGPDVATARELIDRAGVRGAAVTVRALDFPEHLAIGRYFVELLEDLGFKASLTAMSLDDLFAIEDVPGANFQMIGFWVGVDNPTPSAMIAGLFTCPDYRPYPGTQENWSVFCDRDIEAKALAAYDLQATDPVAANRAWATVDRLIVDQSPAVAAINPIELALVSKRVGNVQLHPVLKVLVSQMWVQ
jgi:YVTN family beta-propeller protein